MKAKKKSVETLTAAELGMDITPSVRTLRARSPLQRSAGIKAPDVATLAAKLKNEAKVI